MFRALPGASLNHKHLSSLRKCVSSPIYLCDVSWPEVGRPPLCMQCFLIFEPEFAIVNPHLLRELVARKMWGNEIKQSIIAANGSVQHLQLPEDIKAMYESSHVSLSLFFSQVFPLADTRLLGKSSSVRLSIWQPIGLWRPERHCGRHFTRCNRGAFIDQSQSLNLFVSEPNFAKALPPHLLASLALLVEELLVHCNPPSAHIDAFLRVEKRPQDRFATPGAHTCCLTLAARLLLPAHSRRGRCNQIHR